MNELIAVEKIAGWEKLKALVLDSVSSPITKCVYNMALNEFLAWFQHAPRSWLRLRLGLWGEASVSRGISARTCCRLPLRIRRIPCPFSGLGRPPGTLAESTN